MTPPSSPTVWMPKRSRELNQTQAKLKPTQTRSACTGCKLWSITTPGSQACRSLMHHSHSSALVGAVSAMRFPSQSPPPSHCLPWPATHRRTSGVNRHPANPPSTATRGGTGPLRGVGNLLRHPGRVWLRHDTALECSPGEHGKGRGQMAGTGLHHVR